ncbi:MAG: hypothetical protein ACHP93_00605 [Solirubrobacterales bacterium]
MSRNKVSLAESALAAPFASAGGHDFYADPRVSWSRRSYLQERLHLRFSWMPSSTGTSRCRR